MDSLLNGSATLTRVNPQIFWTSNLKIPYRIYAFSHFDVLTLVSIYNNVYILVREDWVFEIILFLTWFSLTLLLFWQISALDLESINVKFYFKSSMCLTFFCVVFVFLLLMIFVIVGVAFLTLLERRVLGYIHIRRGPNKVGFIGLFQPFRDAIKLFTREQYFSLVSNYFIYYFSPIFVFFFLYWFGYWFLT